MPGGVHRKYNIMFFKHGWYLKRWSSKRTSGSPVLTDNHRYGRVNNLRCNRLSSAGLLFATYLFDYNLLDKVTNAATSLVGPSTLHNAM